MKTRYTEMVIPSCETLNTSSVIRVIGRVEPISDGALLDKKRLMISEIFPYRLSLFSPNDWNLRFQHYLLSSRRYLYSLLLDSLGKYYGGLIIAVVLGNTDWLVESIQPYFKITGTLHILAASGQNVALLILAIEPLLPSFIPRYCKGCLLTATVGVYVALVGLQPSIVRAALMFLLMLISRYFLFVQYNALYSLLLSSSILLILRPEWATSIGFLLSVSATLSIILLFPFIERTFLKLLKNVQLTRSNKMQKYETTIRSYVIESSVAGVAAEIATLPIVLSQFGTAQTLAFIPSLAVGWVVPLMINGSLLFITLVSLFRLLVIPTATTLALSHQLALILVIVPTDIFIKILSTMSRFNWGTVSNPWLVS